MPHRAQGHTRRAAHATASADAPMVSLAVALEGPREHWSHMLGLALAQTLERPDELQVVAVCIGHDAPSAADAAACLGELEPQPGIDVACVQGGANRQQAWAAGLEACTGRFVMFLDKAVRAAPGIVTMVKRFMVARDVDMMSMHMRVFDTSTGDFASSLVSARHDNDKLPAQPFSAAEHPERLFQLLPGDTSAHVFKASFLREQGLLPRRLALGLADPMPYAAALQAGSLVFLNLPMVHRSIDFGRLYAGISPLVIEEHLGQVAGLAEALEGPLACLRRSWAQWAVDTALQGLPLMPPQAQERALDCLAGHLGELVDRFARQDASVGGRHGQAALVPGASRGADGDNGTSGDGDDVDSGDGQPPEPRVLCALPSFERALRAVEAARMGRAALVAQVLDLAGRADEQVYERAYLAAIASQDAAGAPAPPAPTPRRRRLFRR